MILRNMPVVVIGQAQIEKNAEDERKIEQHVVQAILSLEQILNMPVDAEYP